MKRALLLALVAMLLISTALPALAVSNSKTLAKRGDKYYVYCKKLNVRSGPGAGYSVRKVVRQRTKVTFLKEVSGWWLVKLPGGTKGYLDRQYLTPVHVKGPGWYRLTRTTKYHARPRTTAKTLGSIKSGKYVWISAACGDWGRTTYNGKTGWLALKYVTK